jgi:hypothetical protein
MGWGFDGEPLVDVPKVESDFSPVTRTLKDE